MPEEVQEPDTGRRRWAGLAVLAISLGLVVLDGTIVGVSLPVIIEDLGLSLTDAEWVNSLYSVVFAALLLTAGRLGDRFGRRNTLLIGILSLAWLWWARARLCPTPSPSWKRARTSTS